MANRKPYLEVEYAQSVSLGCEDALPVRLGNDYDNH